MNSQAIREISLEANYNNHQSCVLIFMFLQVNNACATGSSALVLARQLVEGGRFALVFTGHQPSALLAMQSPVIATVELSVCLSVRPSVRHTGRGSVKNG